MKTTITQLAALRLRSLIYKNLKKHVAGSPAYQQWRSNRGKSQLAQLEAHSQWRRQQTWQHIERLSQGLEEPSHLELAALHFRSCLYRHLKNLFKRTRGFQQWQLHRNESKASQISARLRWRMLNKALLASRILKGTSETARGIRFPSYANPIVSILIPVYNKIEYTLTCLWSIQQYLPKEPFEIIVIDDCSSDETPRLLALVDGIRIIRNDTNLGFLRNCNRAAGDARGEYLLFLNNDTEVQPGWMDELLWTFRAFPDAGLAGSKLIFPYGLLQEAGGIIWSDASGCNYGRESDPDRPEFCYLRDVDYCSGASLMIPAELFNALGGFDERFCPAYYEDTDLAFSVRKHGRRVLFQPFSKVVHHEGITSGTDVTKGIKSYQLRNQARFMDKWRDTLALHEAPNQQLLSARERCVTKRALIIDVTTPLPDQDSGSVDAIREIEVMQVLDYKVTFIPDDLQYSGPYTEALQRKGVECLYQPYVGSVARHLEVSGAIYDLVIIKRIHYAAKHIDDIRRYCQKAKIIFNTVDLHFLREERQAAIEMSAALLEQARKTKELEYSLMKRSHATITISDAERNLVLSEHPELAVAAIPYIRDVAEYHPPFSARRDIVFIGGFRHSPNVDALLNFVQEVWPQVLHELPGIKLRIVGSNAPPEITELGKVPGIAFHGHVPDLDTIFHHCRLSVAPLRFGAGIKGKIGTSLSYGVPCVASPVAAEGMQLTDEQNILIAAKPADFVASIVKAYTNEAVWNLLSANGIAYMRSHYSFEQGVERYRALIDSITISSEMTT